MLGHKGALTGFTADMFHLPSRRATIIVLENGENGSLGRKSISDAATVSIAGIVVPAALAS